MSTFQRRVCVLRLFVQTPKPSKLPIQVLLLNFAQRVSSSLSQSKLRQLSQRTITLRCFAMKPSFHRTLCSVIYRFKDSLIHRFIEFQFWVYWFVDLVQRETYRERFYVVALLRYERGYNENGWCLSRSYASPIRKSQGTRLTVSHTIEELVGSSKAVHYVVRPFSK